MIKKTLSILICLFILLNTAFVSFAAQRGVDAKMLYSEDFSTWNEVTNDTSVFSISDFEPGSKATRYLKIKNTGEGAFTYTLKAICENKAILSDVIEVYVKTNVSGITPLSEMTYLGTLSDVLNSINISEGQILPTGEANENFYNEETSIAITLKMKSDADSSYMNKNSGEFKFQLTVNECEYAYTPVDKFEIKFENTDKYLYRVGNENPVALGSLFKAIEGAKIGNVTAEVVSLDSETTVSGEFSPNIDWTKATIQFKNSGPVEVKIYDDDYSKVCSLKLEVVDGKNITKRSDLENKSCVLLNDIEMTSNTDAVYFSGNATFYGNGFTFDVSKGAYKGAGYVRGNYLVYISNANLDNIKIVGAVYTEYGGTTDSNYNRATVLADGNCKITNCYFSNCASPLRTTTGTIEIKNTTLKGGNFANLDVRDGNLILDNVTTINQVNSNDKASDGSVIVGLGIVIYYESVPSTASIEIKNGITQYNIISKNEANKYYTNSYAQTLSNFMFNSSNKSVQYSYEGDTYVNTGILSMTDTVPTSNITDLSSFGYSKLTPSFSGKSGYLQSKVPDASSITNVPPLYESIAQDTTFPKEPTMDYISKNYIPVQSGSNDFCYYNSTSDQVEISFDAGETFDWDTDIFNLKKCGKDLDYSVTMNGTDYTNKSISFSEAGNYIIIYTYTDPYNYTINDSGTITKSSKTYTKEVKISVSVVEAQAKNAEFDFVGTGLGTKYLSIGNITYVMPDATGTSSSVGSKSVDGNTIYYPITNLVMSDNKTSHSSGWYAYFKIFKDVVTITDYENQGTGNAIIYNGETTKLPANLSPTNPTTTFKYGSSSASDGIASVKNGYLCYSSPKIEADRNAQTPVVEYTYKDNKGTTFIYYVGYYAPAQEYSPGCLTKGTLITLSNGTTKPVEDITYNDKLLAWDLFNGKYVEAPISLIIDHGEQPFKTTELNFSNGYNLKIAEDHTLYNVDLKKFVLINHDTISKYAGNRFAVSNSEHTANEYATLESYKTSTESIKSYSLATAVYYNCIANGILTVTPDPVEGWYDIFEIDDNMKYTKESIEEYIEKYGLYTYDDFSEYISYETYLAFNAPYLKIPVGKGLFTFEDILTQIDKWGLGYNGSSPDVVPRDNNEISNYIYFPETINEEAEIIEPKISLLSETDNIVTSLIITSGTNNITSAGFEISVTSSDATETENGFTINSKDAIFKLTASGEASKGYAKITLDGETYYSETINKGSYTEITVKNAVGMEISFAPFWGDSGKETVSVINAGEFTIETEATENGITVIFTNTTKTSVIGDIYVAVYNNTTNTLSGVNVERNITIDGKGSHTFSSEFALPENYSVKVFIWNGMAPVKLP